MTTLMTAPRSSVCRAKNPSTCRYHGNFSLPTTPPDYQAHLQESAKHRMLMSDAEQETIKGYLDQDYMVINGYLKTGEQPTPEIQKKIRLLDSALQKHATLNTGKQVVTYRATKAYREFGNKREAAEWIAENFPVGEEITLPGFTSSTENPTSLFDFLPEAHEDMRPSRLLNPDYDSLNLEEQSAFLQKVFGPNRGLGNLVFVVKSSQGTPVSGYGQMFSEKEQEYLFPRDSKFRVERILPYRKVENPNRNAFRKQAHATVIYLTETT